MWKCVLPGSPGLDLLTAPAIGVLSFRAASSDHLHDLSGAGVPAAVFSSYAPAAESFGPAVTVRAFLIAVYFNGVAIPDESIL